LPDADDDNTPLPHGVLVAEDEPTLRNVLELALRGAGFRVWSAPDGQAALELCRRHKGEIDVVVSDVRMPRLDGPGLLATLRSEDPCVLLLFVTGDAGAYDPEGLLAAGADGVVSKPFRVADLVEAVRVLAQTGRSGG
jgi:CheY-like chemotaxis protein